MSLPTGWQVMVPQRAGEKEQLPGAARAGAKSFKFDACLPGSTTQVWLREGQAGK